MTHASILGPPRSGRKVLTEKQALAEVESYQDQPDVDIDSKIPQSPRDNINSSEDIKDHKSLVHPYFKVMGRFNVGKIEDIGGTYVFRDLELPMGCWTYLELSGALELGNKKTFGGWIQYTNSENPRGVMPLDIRYGLMAVCFLKQSDPRLGSLARHIKNSVWYTDAVDHRLHNATMINYVTGNAIVTPGAGWGSSHPFGQSYSAFVAGQETTISPSTKGPYLQEVLKNILGEDDIERASQVLNWSTGSTESRLLPGSRIISQVQATSITMIDRQSYLDLICNHKITHPARMIRAHPANYQPR